MSQTGDIDLRQLAILGGGVWGSSLAKALHLTTAAQPSPPLHFCFWSRNSAQAQKLAAEYGGTHHNTIADIAPRADLIIVAVSSGGFCDTLQQIANCFLDEGKSLTPILCPPILWLTKGFVNDDNLLCEAAAKILPSQSCYGALSGPTFAQEIAAGLPAAMVLATNQKAQLQDLQQILHRKMLRLYASDDLLGVCVGGALKNVIAIAAGICDGLQLGANARAAIITRGLAEINTFNKAIGGRPDTIAGIAGIGDLLLTCTSDLSRNRQFGLAIGQGKIIPTQSNQTNMTTEGVAAAAAAHRRATQLKLTVPIIAAVHEILQGNLPPNQAADSLLSRPLPSL